MSLVLALDPSRHCGWAIDDPANSGRPLGGVWDLPGNQEQYGKNGLALSTHLVRTILMYQPKLLVYERPLDPRNFGHGADDDERPGPKRKKFMASFETVRMLCGLPMIIETVAEKHGIETMEVFVASWRSHFTGTLKGGKEPTMARCRQLRWQYRDSNQADAAGIWCFAKCTTDPTFRPQLGQ